MKKLKVDLEEIGSIMENQDRSIQEYYLDKENGKVVVIPEEVTNVIEGHYNIDNLPDWERELLEIAEKVLSSNQERYVRIPERPSYEGYNLMAEFTENIEDEQFREKLFIALNGKGAFRRFKNVLFDFPNYEKKWYSFKQARLAKEVCEWLSSIDIKCV